MILKDLLKIHYCGLNDKVKRLCAVEFADNISEIVDFLKIKIPEKMPSDSTIQSEFSNSFKEKYEIISINDNRYPELLRKTDIAPVVLNTKGNVDCFQNKNVALVGSRKLDKNDFIIIRNIVKSLNDLNIGIISGLAKGSDVVAQCQSLTTGTIAVLPCGLKHCYPLEHEKIIDKIINFGGTVVSIFPFSDTPKKMNFVKRNAIIVGMSNSLILARARTLKCGSMISAHYANEFKKTIYTMIFKGESEGNKFLLEKGQAVKITNLEELKYSILIDIAKNKNDDDFIENDNLETSLFEFNSNFEHKNIEDKIEEILRYLNVRLYISRISYVYNICCRKMNVSSQKDKQKILITLLEKTFK